MNPFTLQLTFSILLVFGAATSVRANDDRENTAFFESKIRPILIKHCYECHSEQAGEQQGGLLLDRQSGWLQGGDTNKAVIPGEPEASLLIAAVSYESDELQMPPDGRLDDDSISLLTRWIKNGAAGPSDDMGETEFSRLGDQEYLFDQAKSHWAFQPVNAKTPPENSDRFWNRTPIDRFVYGRLAKNQLEPARRANLRDLCRRLHFDLTGLPPTFLQICDFEEQAKRNRMQALTAKVTELLNSPEFGQHIARMWLDLARYADTDSTYRPDTKTPHYMPFAFSYRDYVVDAFNSDKPIDQFLKEQFAADLMGFESDAPEMAALGFLAVGPHANRAQEESLDDWIDVTTRGLMGMTVACARCHDHKYEPIPTVDYYSLRGVFAALDRPHPLDEKKQPLLDTYRPSDEDRADFEAKLGKIQKQMADAKGKKARNNNRSITEKIRDTQLGELLLFHPGAPSRAMVVREKKKRPESFVHVRGDARARGEKAPPRFLRILEPEQPSFPETDSGRLELIQRIACKENPLTARVYVNRVWGHLIGSHLVSTPSDFGLQGEDPTHPLLLDWLADDFVRHGWSTKHLVKQIVLSETYAQSSQIDDQAEGLDPTNRLLARANRKRLSIESLRDNVLFVARRLDITLGGHAAPLWEDGYTRKRAIYGYINRFNLDPTLRAFDFPTPMQSQAARGESIVAPQALFLMNSSFVIDQANAIVGSTDFSSWDSDDDRIQFLFQRILQRNPVANEIARSKTLINFQVQLEKKVKNRGRFVYNPWPMVAQALMMSNEFQYVD